MRAVVLVGGQGTRLRPLTLTIPKQMLPIVELPMIERVLGHLAAFGVDDAVLSMGYRPDAFLSAFPNDRCAGVSLTYAVEPEPLDTAGAIAFAAKHGGIDDTFVVVNGDVLTDLDVGELVDRHVGRGAHATIALTPVDDPSAYGVVSMDGDGRVVAFVEKPAPNEAPSNLINAGTYVVEPSVLDRIPAGRPVSIEREVFPALVAERTLFAVASDAYWLDTGTPLRYLQAHHDLLDGVRGDPPAPGAAVRAPGVWTLGAAVIDGELQAPTLVGDAAFVARGSLVRRSVVGGGARILEDAVVVDSVLLPGAVVQPGARVEGSIVGERAVVGEGAVVRGLTVLGDGVEVPAGSVREGELVPQP